VSKKVRTMTVSELIDFLNGYPPEVRVELRVGGDGCVYSVPLEWVSSEERKKTCNLGHEHVEGKFIILGGGEE
jgi:hypothetical protein